MEGIRCLIEQVRKTGRAIDILVNNAGSLIKRTHFLEITEDLWNMV
jgi:NAD(P)-dependent dehydrogenase (short-subunit alcohol dehydrogenase family)